MGERRQCQRLGFWWSDKKCRELNNFDKVCRKFGFDLVKLDLARPVEEQGPFVAIVHKLCDCIVKADGGDVESQRICDSLEDYCSRHPEMVFVDPLDNVRKILNRYRQYKLIEESSLAQVDWIYVPPFVELTSSDVDINLALLRTANINFPIVCKPILSHGRKEAHVMSLVFNEKGLRDVKTPCVAQQFVNHNSVLFKVYVIGSKFYQSVRPSVKNFTGHESEDIIVFHSQDVSKPHSASPLIDAGFDFTNAVPMPSEEKIGHIVNILTAELGQQLYGFDIIVDSVTGKLSVIDVNNFPGYYGMDNFLDMLCKLLGDLIAHKQALYADDSELLDPIDVDESVSPAAATKKKVTKEEEEGIGSGSLPEDSGIDTCDSSDDRKKPYVPKCHKRQYSRSLVNSKAVSQN